MNRRTLTVSLCVLALALTPTTGAVAVSDLVGPALDAERDDARSLAQPIDSSTFEEAWQQRLDGPEATDELPQPVEQIQPGSKILVDIVGFGQNRCTASWVVQDEAGDYYIATAGHCVLPGEAFEPHPEIKRTTDPGYEGANVAVCVANCESETQGGDEAYVALGDVLFGQYVDRRYDSIGLGYDLAFIEIPVRHYDIVDPGMARWDGPDTAGDVTLPEPGDVALQYGHGTALGDAWLTEGRTGVFDGDTRSRGEDCHHENDGCTVAYAGAASGGDSGSPLAIGAPAVDTDGVEAEHAIAITTHITGYMYAPIVRANVVWGTHIQQAMEITEEVTGHDITFVGSNETLPLPAPLAPERLTVDDPGSGDSLVLDWDEGRTTLPIDRYEVYRSTGTSSFETKTLVNETPTIGLEDTGLSLGETYCYQIVAVDEDGQASPPSTEDCATTTKQAPPAPAIRAENPGLGGELTVAWTEPEHPRAIAAYELERSIDGGSWTQLATTSERFYVDENLDETSTYRYRVTAVDEDGLESDPAATEARQPTQDEPTWRQADRDAQGTSFTGATGDLSDPSVATTELTRSSGDAPRVADLDEDGTPDIVTVGQATDRGERVVVEARELATTQLAERWSTQLPATMIAGLQPTSGTASTAIADVDADGDDEVIAYAHYRVGDAQPATEDGAVFVLDGTTGDIEASYNGAIGFGTETHPRVGDVDGDGTPEIVVVDEGAELIVLASEGGNLDPVAAGSAGSGSVDADPVLGDFAPERDGLEVALATTSDEGGHLVTCRPDPGALDCRTVGDVPAGAQGLAAAALEPVFTPSLITHVDAQPGLVVRPTAPAGANATADVGPLANAPAVGPIGPEGRPAIVSGLADPSATDVSDDGDLLAHSHESGRLEVFDHLERRGSVDEDRSVAGQTIADVNGDGDLDVLAADADGRVLAHTPSTAGSPETLWTVDLGEGVDHPPVLADVDGDGTAEAVVAAAETIAVIG